MCPTNAANVSSSVLVLALAAPITAAEAAADSGQGPRRLGGLYDAGTVERALDRARRRLEQPAVPAPLHRFPGRERPSPPEALDRAGPVGRGAPRHALFYDGTGQRPCDRPATLAFTWPGSPIVFVCAQQFVAAARRDPFLAEAALIHEGLHSLGLGENPPTSSAITSRVMHRCGG